ncbi:MAG: short-chain dehydrogenase [Actinomycetia bacterium]|nr:short-chain dehydrogenase [Actinomycetes bacterium]
MHVGALTGKAVVITGAGGGLGRAYALHAGAAGGQVIVNDVDGERADAVVAEIRTLGGTAFPSANSVTEWEGAAAIVADCRDAFGRIDGLVNNAGVNLEGGQGGDDEHRLRLTVEVNLLGALFVGEHAITAMKAQRSGSIVNISSAAHLGIPGVAAYGATKGALASLTYCWALDLRAHGVRVNGYLPQGQTPGSHAVEDERLVALVQGQPTPEDNAALVTYLLGDASAGVTGQVIARWNDSLVVLAPPDLTEHGVAADAWPTDVVEGRFDPVLRSGLQPLGDPRFRV